MHSKKHLTKRQLALAIAAATTAAAAPLAYAQSSAKDCLPVLAKDIQIYAQRNNMQLDFLRSINAESWAALQQSNSADALLVGLFSYSNNYKTFSEKRDRYLESVHYVRTEQQATDILKITTSDRAYPAYEACILKLPAGSGLQVWASRETMDRIELRVLYHNRPGQKSIRLTGYVEGGVVVDAPAQRLWSGEKRWGVNEELPLTIHRTPGTAITYVKVVPGDGSPAVDLAFPRADGTLTVTYAGTTDVPRGREATSAWGVTPDNDNHHDTNCPNYVGQHDGVCTSRTDLPTLTTAEPYFFVNPGIEARGGGCPWSTYNVAPKSISADGRAVSASILSWGTYCEARIFAERWERLTAASCGPNDAVPVIANRPALLAARKECGPIASIEWKLHTSGASGVMKFGDDVSADGVVHLSGARVDSGTVEKAAFQLTLPQGAHSADQAPAYGMRARLRDAVARFIDALKDFFEV